MVENYEGEVQLTPSFSGNMRIARLDFTRLGNHSCSFQAPLSPPVSCPHRMEVAFKAVLLAAFARILSDTHLLSPYPSPIALSGSVNAVSGASPS